MVLNAYAMSWFDFQNTCRLLGQEMPSETHQEKPYWTKYYKRQSDWIGKYGCYNSSDLQRPKTFYLHLPSAGLCQEFCMENNKSNAVFFFGVQKDKCICLSEYPTTSSLPLKECNFGCSINSVLNNSLECGGSLVYSVFVSGRELSISDKTSILFCQQCAEKGCLFVNCTSHLNSTNSTKNMLSTAHPAVWKTITKTIIPNITAKTVSLMWLTYTKSVSSYQKQTLIHGANISRTTQSTSKEDTIKKDSMTFIVWRLASSTVICFLFLMVAIYFKRKHTLIEEKCSTLQKQIECSRYRYEQTSIAKLNPQNKQDHHYVTGTSYYELAKDSKINEKCYKNKENKEPCYDIREKVSGNNVYMVASYKTLDGESVNFDKKDYSYDHLRGISRSRHEENTYDHAGNVNESSYFCVEVARNWNNRHIDNDLYDHI